MYDHLEVIQLLLDRGANPNAFDMLGHTPLILSARKGHLEVVKLLLDRGADPNAFDIVGHSWTYPPHRIFDCCSSLCLYLSLIV